MTHTLDNRCILLFVRFPERGKVKSRLAREMNEDFVLRLYESMVMDTIDMLKRTKIPFRICFDPPDKLTQLKQWLGQEHTYMPQCGIDIGDRMEKAFMQVFLEEVKEILLVGSDIPGLTTTVIGEAFAALSSHDVVIGPANDGGYYMIGFQKNTFSPGIFHNMTWSTDRVYPETVTRLLDEERSMYIVRECIDIDTREDLIKVLLAAPDWQKTTAVRTLRLLRNYTKSITG